MIKAVLHRALSALRYMFRIFGLRRGRSQLRELDLAAINALLNLPPGRELTEPQARAVSSNASETLVVAGAGSGKTTLLINRAKYLVASGRSDGSDILMLAFNKAAANELRDRAQASELQLRATTFHALGNSIIKAPDERTGVAFADAGERHACLERSLREELTAHQQSLLVQFFTTDLVPLRPLNDFKNLAEYSEFVRAGIPVTLQGEQVKSHGEWLIANHLYRCGISYEYEALYSESDEAKNRHRPDFTITTRDGRKIYVEYFGIDRAGGTAPGIDREAYAESMRWKMEVHTRNDSILMPLHYFDLAEGRLIALLDAAFRRHSVEIDMRSDSDLLAQANKIGYTNRFLATCEQFLSHVRSQALSATELRRKSQGNPRTTAFVTVFEALLHAYERELDRQGLPDFPQLITGAVAQLRDGKASLPVRHLLVDEFQDISADRFALISAIREQAVDCEVTFVGDDWQSIYEFSGSDIGIMRRAARPAKHRVRIDMGDTYRLPAMIAEASRSFVLRNPSQLSKGVRSLSPTPDLGRIVTHWDTELGKPEGNFRLVISRLGDAARDPQASLRVLARYRDHLPPEAEVRKLWAGPVSVGTVHSSKGLEADYVIVTDLVADARGFPSIIQDDPVMQLVLPEREPFPHAEERRLFYVALTRARREVHLIAPRNMASQFAYELFDMGVGEHFGLDRQSNPACPTCDSGRLLRSGRTGAQYCSNLPLCDFFPPRCGECNARMRFDWDLPNGYVCADHPSNCPPACPRCNWGLMVTREYVNRRTGFHGVMTSCHTWPRTGCDGKPKKEPRRAPTGRLR